MTAEILIGLGVVCIFAVFVVLTRKRKPVVNPPVFVDNNDDLPPGPSNGFRPGSGTFNVLERSVEPPAVEALPVIEEKVEQPKKRKYTRKPKTSME